MNYPRCTSPRSMSTHARHAAWVLVAAAAAASSLSACESGPAPVSPTTTLPDGAVATPPSGASGGGGSGGGGVTSGSTSGGGGGGTTGGGGTPGTAGASGCKPLNHTAGATFGGVTADTYAWYDEACKLRTSGLVPNTSGSGGYARGFTYEAAGRMRSAMGTNTHGWNGFGYVVAHYGNTAVVSQGATGTYRVVLAGAHHALHEFKMRLQATGPFDVTVQWFFATGRSNPIYAITYDASPAGPDTVSADTRSPYGDVAFDEGPSSDGNVDGVGWGDKYRFVSTGSGPLTFANAWEYTQPNTVPYSMAWASKADAEMGLVQTQTFLQHEAGGDYGGGVLAAECWGKTSATQGAGCKDPRGVMPNDWLWPMQLNQWELPFTGTSHRVAWGSTYGAVGKKSYSAFGINRTGYPYNSYSVAVVLGPHSAKPVDAQRTAIEAHQSTKLTATRGTVATSGPGGVGRTDSVAYAPPGYNPIYAAWELTAAKDAVTAQIAAEGSPLKNPIVRVLGFTKGQVAHVRVGGRELAADSGYFATIDAASKVLWVTFNQTLTGTTTVEIE